MGIKKVNMLSKIKENDNIATRPAPKALASTS